MSSTTLPVCPKTGSTSPSLTVHLCLHTAPGNRECALERFRKTLAADYPETVKKALLFGSKARGDWTAESDIDVMVIVKDKAANSQERIAEMGEELVFSAECWSATPCVLTRTESEWAKGLSWGLAFHEAVEGEGVTLL